MPRPTLLDLAQAAGVSVATVDRVLNGRHPVRADTARRVSEAAEAIGYHAAGLIRRRLADTVPRHRLGFLLQRPDQEFFRQFEAQLCRAVEQASGFQGTAQVEFLDAQTPAEVTAKLMALGRHCHAIGVVAIDHPTIGAAVAELRERGVPVFSLLSDCAPGARLGYVGLDNRKAGRTAGWLIAHTAPRPGKLGIFVGSHRFAGHELREIGFRTYFREHAPQFEVLEAQVNLEAGNIAHEAVLTLLARHPDLVGLYVAGGGMEGTIAALREENTAGRLAVVCNEITGATKAALAEGFVTALIATPLQDLSEQLVALMGAALGTSKASVPDQTVLPFGIVVSESL